MNFLKTALLSAVVFSSSLAAARPMVAVSLRDETTQIDKTMQELRSYMSRQWGIGVHPETLQPDQFLKFFVQRSLPFKYYVRSLSGFSIGEPSAYLENMKTLRAYRLKIIREELQDAKKILLTLQALKEKGQPVGFQAEGKLPNFLPEFFAERGIRFAFFVNSAFVNVGDTNAYDQNIEALKAYIRLFEKAAAQETPATSL